MYDFGTKTKNTAPSVSGIHHAAEFNNSHTELKGAVTSSGLSLTSPGSPPGEVADSDVTQLSQAIARYASGGIIASCSGSANTYVLAAKGSFVVPKALFDGMMVVTTINATNSGASTANVFGLGSKKVLAYNGSALQSGALLNGRMTAWQYSAAADSAAGAWLLLPWAAANTESTSLQTIALPILTRWKSSGTGSFTWTVPAGVTRVRIKAWGGGGGGGYTTGGAPAGGGGGAFVEYTFNVTPGQNITGSVGAGGTGAWSGADGTNGGNTTVTYAGNTSTAGGGPGAVRMSSGNGNSPGRGSPSGFFDVGLTGEQGGVGMIIDVGVTMGGIGGSSPLGGASCAGGQGTPSNGSVPGGGGGGSGYSPAAGGNGARGEVWIEYLAP